MTSSRLDISRIVQALKLALPEGDRPLPLHEPFFGGNEWKYVKACLDSGYVSSIGSYVDEFEKRLADFTGVSRAVAVVNGTAALHICLKLCGVEPNDEVILPSLTFVATANAVMYCHAVPHFADSDEKTLSLDPVKLMRYLAEISIAKRDGCYNRFTGRRIKAVLPVHTFGHPADLDPLKEICLRYGLELIEDASESLGTYYKGRHTGNWGKLSALSFNGNKIITTGGGGAILTNDDELGRLAKHITTTAKIPHPWEFCHDRLGYNYRLPNLNAALGCAQMEELPQFIEQKRKIAQRYREVFEPICGVRFYTESEFAQSNYWLNVLILDEQIAGLRDDLIQACHAEEIMVRPAWTLMHKLPMYAEQPHMDLSTSESLAGRIVNLPSSPTLGD